MDAGEPPPGESSTGADDSAGSGRETLSVSSDLSPKEAQPKDVGEATLPVVVLREREYVRGMLASFLIAVLGAAILGGGVLLANGIFTVAELRTVTELLITPLFAIVGTVLGFYFGSSNTAEGRAADRTGTRKKARPLKERLRGK